MVEIGACWSATAKAGHLGEDVKVMCSLLWQPVNNHDTNKAAGKNRNLFIKVLWSLANILSTSQRQLVVAAVYVSDFPPWAGIVNVVLPMLPIVLLTTARPNP